MSFAIRFSRTAALLVATTITLGSVPGLATAATWTSADSPATNYLETQTKLRADVLNEVNRVRSAPQTCGDEAFAPAAPLTLNTVLNNSAFLHSKDMAINDYFDHMALDGRDPFDRMEDAGYTITHAAGENIAYGIGMLLDAGSVVTAWMKSPGHCVNIMSPDFEELGVGVYYSEGRILWTQNFGTGLSEVVDDVVPAATIKKLKTATPTISGIAKVGKTLTAKPGTWTSGTKFSYQWYRDGKKITGATKATYKLTSSDRGKQITVKVTGSKSGYAKASKTSAKTTKVAYGTLTTAKPKISGTVKVGKKLTAKPGTWTSGTTFNYQWYRDSKKITGATKSTYKLAKSDAGKRITVKVKGTKSGYTSVTRTSSKTAKIKK
ncbi:CAP domain-containing protein [Tessaracoccus caeni]|uniref:CAP domain-containing protein n=1 Tax=Tessaracoccus caeni TaxID=3031239 RepID=UPI0023DA4792|nr:CAP domain-containing protein [Tessaracoccus caeni]MDF1489550.1 CAP domain-containing protein [Tessaracoccus caeni]